jgi:hypothetical protein
MYESLGKCLRLSGHCGTLANMATKNHINVYLDNSILEAIQRKADEEKRSLSQTIALLLEKALAQSIPKRRT